MFPAVALPPGRSRSPFWSVLHSAPGQGDARGPRSCWAARIPGPRYSPRHDPDVDATAYWKVIGVQEGVIERRVRPPPACPGTLAPTWRDCRCRWLGGSRAVGSSRRNVTGRISTSGASRRRSGSHSPAPSGPCIAHRRRRPTAPAAWPTSPPLDLPPAAGRTGWLGATRRSRRAVDPRPGVHGPVRGVVGHRGILLDPAVRARRPSPAGHVASPAAGRTRRPARPCPAWPPGSLPHKRPSPAPPEPPANHRNARSRAGFHLYRRASLHAVGCPETRDRLKSSSSRPFLAHHQIEAPSPRLAFLLGGRQVTTLARIPAAPACPRSAAPGPGPPSGSSGAPSPAAARRRCPPVAW